MQEKKPEQIRRIKQISVSNLFGMFDHTIPLNLDERITIIHGPNGFGKTAILRLLNELFGQINGAIQSTPFAEFRVLFDDGEELWVAKKAKPSSTDVALPHRYGKANLLRGVIIHFNDPRESVAISLPLSYLLTRFSNATSELTLTQKQLYAIEAQIKMLEIQIMESQEIEMNDNDYTRRDHIYELKRAADEYTRERGVLMSFLRDQEWSHGVNIDDKKKLSKVINSTSIHYIETQRLLNQVKAVNNGDKDHPKMVPTVMAYSRELVEIIKTKLAASTALSQSLDRTFPGRVVNPTVRQLNVDLPGLRQRLEGLEAKRSYLMATGLIDQDNTAFQIRVSDQIDESTQMVLSVYADDTEQKLGVFDEVANKIDLLKKIINKRFLYKEMTISKTKGFVFTNANGVVLSSTDLSSGEQHELVLFYELLFKVAPGSLVLIDEPEISLHVVWQEQFLRDVQEVTRLSNIDVLIATHSPDVIDGLSDLMVELKEPGSGGLPRIRA